MKKLVPLSDRILVKKIDSTLKAQSKIILTTAVQSNEAVVVEVGPGIEKSDGTRKSMHVKKDDIIIYDARFGFEIDLEGEKYLILKDTDVMAVVKDVVVETKKKDDDVDLEPNGC